MTRITPPHIVNNKRIYAFDVVRVLATVFVVSIHSSGVVENHEYGTDEYWIGYLWFCLVKVAVPLFLLLSGALVLAKPIELTKDSLVNFYKKRFFRVVIPFLFFSVIHFYFFQHQGTNYLKALIAGGAGIFHWYVYMICVFYVFVPFLSNILNTGERVVDLSIVILLQLLLLFNIQPGFFGSQPLRTPWFPYIYLFVMGFYLNLYKERIKRCITNRQFVLILILCYLLGIITVLTGLCKKMPLLYYLPLSITLFVYLITRDYKNTDNRLIQTISQYSYAIYLCHGPIVCYFWYHPLTDIYALSIIVNFMVTFILSFIIVFFISKIPKGNYLLGLKA